jgi:hypothetical protein
MARRCSLQCIMQSLANSRGLRAQVFQYIMQSLANYRAMHMRIKALEVDPRGAGFALQAPPRPGPPGPPATDGRNRRSAVCGSAQARASHPLVGAEPAGPALGKAAGCRRLALGPALSLNAPSCGQQTGVAPV